MPDAQEAHEARQVTYFCVTQPQGARGVCALLRARARGVHLHARGGETPKSENVEHVAARARGHAAASSTCVRAATCKHNATPAAYAVRRARGVTARRADCGALGGALGGYESLVLWPHNASVATSQH